MLGGGQQGGQLGSSPGLQSVLQTALQGLQAPPANAGGLPAGVGGLASAGLQQPSVISMLTPGGGVALPLALASGSVQQQVTTASATSALPNMVHTQFNPPHVLVPANPYLHEGSYILLFYSNLFTSWFHGKTENRIQNFHEFLNQSDFFCCCQKKPNSFWLVENSEFVFLWNPVVNSCSSPCQPIIARRFVHLFFLSFTSIFFGKKDAEFAFCDFLETQASMCIQLKNEKKIGSNASVKYEMLWLTLYYLWGCNRGH